MKLFEAASLLVVSTVFITFVTIAFGLRYAMTGQAFHLSLEHTTLLLEAMFCSGMVFFSMAARQLHTLNRTLAR